MTHVIKTDGTLKSGSASGSGTPGGSDTQVQFNDSSSFNGDSGLTYNKTTNVLTCDTQITIGGNSTASGILRLLEDSDNGSNYIEIKAPSAVTSNTTLTLPDGAGSNTNTLHTNGSGTLSWSAIALATDVSGDLPIANGGTGHDFGSKVVQVVTAISSTTDSTTSNSMSDTSLTASITPTDSNNIIVIYAACYCLSDNPTAISTVERYGYLEIYRSTGTPAVLQGTLALGEELPSASTAQASQFMSTTLIAQETAGSTSAHTYVLRFGSAPSGVRWRVAGAAGPVTMVLMEYKP